MRKVTELKRGPADLTAVVHIGSRMYDLVHIDRATDVSVHVDKVYDFNKNAWYTFASPRWYKQSELLGLDATPQDCRRVIEILTEKDNALWLTRAQRQEEYQKVNESFSPVFRAIEAKAQREIDELFQEV